jgi:hypothetical protein
MNFVNKGNESRFQFAIPTMGDLYVGGLTEQSILNYVVGTTPVSLADILNACGLGNSLDENVTGVTILNPSGASGYVYVGHGAAMALAASTTAMGSIVLGAGQAVTIVVVEHDSGDFENNVHIAGSGASTDVRIILAKTIVPK